MHWLKAASCPIVSITAALKQMYQNKKEWIKYIYMEKFEMKINSGSRVSGAVF
jgi:hypothetical protein